MTEEKIKKVTALFAEEAKKIFGEKLKQVILYGSYARGDYTKDSDVDLMLLVDLDEMELEIYSDELSELGFDYNGEYNIWMMPIWHICPL